MRLDRPVHVFCAAMICSRLRRAHASLERATPTVTRMAAKRAAEIVHGGSL
jgi:hypothetical protein